MSIKALFPDNLSHSHHMSLYLPHPVPATLIFLDLIKLFLASGPLTVCAPHVESLFHGHF